MVAKRTNKNTIKTASLLGMLRQIHLGGLLEECVLEIKDGVARVEAVDITNSLIIICQKTIMNKNISVDLGLGNIGILLKFLSTMDNDKLVFKHSDTGFELKKTNGRRKLDYLLTNPELIATQLQADEEKKKDPLKKMHNMMGQKIELTQSFIKDFLSYINLLKTKDVSIEFDGDEEVAFICGGKNDHNFELILSTEAESEDEEDAFCIKVNGEYLANIFTTISFDEDDPPMLSLAEDKLVMIENDSATWALVPLTVTDSE